MRLEEYNFDPTFRVKQSERKRNVMQPSSARVELRRPIASMILVAPCGFGGVKRKVSFVDLKLINGLTAVRPKNIFLTSQDN